MGERKGLRGGGLKLRDRKDCLLHCIVEAPLLMICFLWNG